MSDIESIRKRVEQYKNLQERAPGILDQTHRDLIALLSEVDRLEAELKSAREAAERLRAELKEARDIADSKESILGDCGTLLCEHFEDRVSWERDKIPAGIQSLIAQIKEECRETERVRAHLSACRPVVEAVRDYQRTHSNADHEAVRTVTLPAMEGGE